MDQDIGHVAGRVDGRRFSLPVMHQFLCWLIKSCSLCQGVQSLAKSSLQSGPVSVQICGLRLHKTQRNV